MQCFNKQYKNLTVSQTAAFLQTVERGGGKGRKEKKEGGKKKETFILWIKAPNPSLTVVQ